MSNRNIRGPRTVPCIFLLVRNHFTMQNRLSLQKSYLLWQKFSHYAPNYAPLCQHYALCFSSPSYYVKNYAGIIDASLPNNFLIYVPKSTLQHLQLQVIQYMTLWCTYKHMMNMHTRSISTYMSHVYA